MITGHVNHTLFWENLAPAGSSSTGAPTGDLAAAIDNAFGSFDAFKTQFNAQTAAVQGSGWGWLGYNKATGKVEIATCGNQDPLSTTGLSVAQCTVRIPPSRKLLFGVRLLLLLFPKSTQQHFIKLNDIW